MWSDEGFTVEYAALGWRTLLATIAAIDPHPAGYYLAVKAWLTVAGDTDFTVRYLSVASATLTAVALYALGRRIAGTAAGLIAGLLLALNPLSVWYGQEARQYALLALVATVATLRLRLALERGSWRSWLLYGLSMAATLHVHYFGLSLAAFHAYLAWRSVLWRPDRLRAFGAFALAGALFLPWWLSAHALEYQGWMDRVDFANAVRRTAWAFAVGTSIYPEYGWLLSAPTLASAGLGLVWLVVSRRSRGDALLLLGWAIVPVLAAYLISVLAGRPAFHERYVSVGQPGLLGLAGVGVGRALTVAMILARGARSRRGWLRPAAAGVGALTFAAVAVALTGGALAADARALGWQFTDPHFSKENLRAVAAFLAPRASADDLLVGAPGRLNLYKRYGAVRMPTLETDVVWNRDRIERELSTALPGHGRVWLLPAGSEVDRAVELWLDRRGYRLDDRWFGLAPLRSYVMSPDPSVRDARASFGPDHEPTIQVSALGTALDRGRDGYRLRVAGDWRKLAGSGELNQSIRILDARGRVVRQADGPLGGQVAPLAGWAVGQRETLRSAVRLPPDLPAGRYEARMVAYSPGGALPVRTAEGQRQDWSIATFDLQPIGSADPRLLDLAEPLDVPVDQRLRLVGAELPSAAVPAGGIADVTLHWQARTTGAFGADGLGSVGVIADGGQPVAAEAGLASRSADAVGALLRDERGVRLPRDAVPGPMSVRLIAGGASITLGRVQVAPPVPRTAVAPPEHPASGRLGGIAIEGYDLAGEPRPGGRLAVTLHWRARDEIATDLTVFVHVAEASGRPVAQSDGEPCERGCPTSTWAPGDAIADRHDVVLPDRMAPGQYRLVVGLYDSRTGVRLARSDNPGPGEADSVVLGQVEVRP